MAEVLLVSSEVTNVVDMAEIVYFWLSLFDTGIGSGLWRRGVGS